jgi:hypothetical protein
MDIEPPKSCDLVEFLRLDQKTFKDRMQVCVANTPQQPNPVPARVNFADFAAVVSKWGWPIPEQLKALAKSSPIKPEPQTAPAPTALERQEARWQACVNEGLPMPTDTYGPYPRGIGKVAKSLGMERQSLCDDLNKYRERMFGN